MTVADIRDKWQGIVNAESKMLHDGPFTGQIMRAQGEQVIKYQAMSSAMYAFRYSQKARVIKWLRAQLEQYQYDAQHSDNEGVRQLSAWSAEVIEAMLQDLN